MNYLVDTNILTRLVEPTHAMHQQARDAVALLVRQAHILCVVSQNSYEFWVVATRPVNVNGLGKTAAEDLADLTYFEGLFHWLDETTWDLRFLDGAGGRLCTSILKYRMRLSNRSRPTG